jgi:transglutaminase-like putative cysteine protease
MSMRLRILHTTTFDYDGTATASYNQARMTPRTTPEQIVLHSRLEVSPAPWTHSYLDYFGTQVTAFEVFDPHQALSVVATSTVQTNRPPASGPQVSWADLVSPEVVDAHTEYLGPGPLVAPPADLAQRAREMAGDLEAPGAVARELCDVVHREVAYLTGSTSVISRASDAWEQRAGVCQDMAHLVIGSLREVGVPARYVSGYLHPSVVPVVGEPMVGESHAWVEWWDDGWKAWDVANDVEPGDRHVVIASGRDYTDVKPLSGIYTGAGTSRMSVEVQVTCLAAAPLGGA